MNSLKLKHQCFFPLLLLLLFSQTLSAQQRQLIKPLPENQWRGKNSFGQYVAGKFLEKVSTKSILISFYGYLERDANPQVDWKIRHYTPEKSDYLVVVEEKHPVEYVRLESTIQQAKGDSWNTFGPWKMQVADVPVRNLAVLVQHQSKGEAPFFVPALVYQSEPPGDIRLYRATFLAGADYSSGTYKVYHNNEVLHEGNIGQQLGGARFNLRIPTSKLPAQGAMLTVMVSLVEAGVPNGPELIFDFYHPPNQ